MKDYGEGKGMHAPMVPSWGKEIQRNAVNEYEQKRASQRPLTELKVHKRENFLGSDFELYTFL
jgi:hypothetical protein